MGGSIMASIINASTSGAGGVITTADASGVLELQSAGTTVINATTVSGNPRITGDFSNATQANRVAFQSSTANGNTVVATIPNGTSVISAYNAFNNSDITNAGVAQLVSTSTEASLRAQITGTGTYLPITFQTSNIERMRIDSDGNVTIPTASSYLYVGSSTYTGDAASGAGGGFGNTANAGVCWASVAASSVAIFNRQSDDGTVVLIRQAGNTEGTISVSGTTVSYNGGHLSRWSQLENETTQVEVYRGTVLESVDAMCEWYKDGELLPNEQATKTIVSTTPASKSVAGVFDMYDLDDEDNPYDFYVAQSGDFVIRVAAGTVVQNGDLLESAGDGTARVQADDICRSSTIAKVTSNYVSETYADGSFCVPCILMIG
jgi:hypothetical protein